MVLTFDTFVLDVEGFVLSQSGREVRLQPRALEVLIYLVLHRDRMVSKEELVAGPWRGTAVTDTAIHQALLLARRALADTSSSPRYLKTVRGRGFRFTAEVSEDSTSGTHALPRRAVAAGTH